MKKQPLMKVQYVGKLEFIAEFNGRRYAFSRRNSILEMPPEAYAYIVSMAGFKADQIIPYNESAELRAKISELEATIESLNGEIEKLKANKRKPKK